MAKQKQSAMIFIMITLLIDCTGFGIIIPVLPDLIKEFTGGDNSVAADYGGYLMVAFALPQFIFSPILGGLSDKYGRRPILLFSLFGLGMDYLFLSFAPSIFWFFIGRIIAGVSGASFTTGMAYIADVSTPEKKAQNFGLVGAAFGLGFILGSVGGGLLSHFGLRVPFMVAAGLSLINWLYGYFILPESLSKAQRRDFSWKRANPIGAFVNATKYPAILGLLVTLLLLYVASHSVQSNWSYYVIEKFQWDPTMIGYSLAVVGITVAIVQGGLIRVIIPKIGNRKAIYLGLTLYVIGFICFAFAANGLMMMLFIIPYCLAGIGGPAMQSIISNQVPENAQGEIQGITTSLQSLAAIIGPFSASHIFAYFIREGTPYYFPGAPFILSAFLTLIGLFIAVKSLRKYH
ncbi:TCR/Tet family MFS transporter [Pedobacter sp. Leaf176]|uniref:TCR/Tet family MFS transporter n=1 Tax=Pedobacter sp. Leaf176 TaxID=1736286 RepID=UPI0007007063|nr:TCR/Tet family MFS transporter [Pedobacter sp. Leaf176]KQR67372.1 MFS transporter [Pedobacter sp. Leaf176]